MPINIIARGGPRDPLENINRLDAAQATDILKRVKAHVNLPNKSSGVFVLVNRGKDGGEMELRRKSGFQLFGRGMSNKRLNDTQKFWNSVLRTAGMDEAADSLAAHLASKPSRKANRVDVSFIQTLLKNHTFEAPIRGPEPAMGIDDVMGHDELPEALGLPPNGGAPPAHDQAVAEAPPRPLAQHEPVGETRSKLIANPSLAPVPRQGDRQAPASGKSVRPPLAEGLTLEEVREKAGMRIGEELGKGQFGTVNQLTLGKDETPRVIKTFHGGEPPTLSAGRTSAANEATAAYLVSKKEAGFAQKAGVAETQYFTVSAGGRFQMVDALGLRALLKQHPEGSVKLHELVMEKADGHEAFHQVVHGHLNPTQRKDLTRQMLTSLTELNRRGFVVRDHKWENVIYDPATNKAKLVDTGMFYKVSKTRKETQFITEGCGTPIYMHARALTGARHGSETDVYAQGIMTLILEHPRAMALMQDPLKRMAARCIQKGFDGSSLEKGLNPYQFRRMVEKEFKLSRNPELLRLSDDLKKPDTLSNLAMRCLELSNKPAADWATPETAQRMLNELSAHPALS
jgi:serine/threonine protein kinase